MKKLLFFALLIAAASMCVGAQTTSTKVPLDLERFVSTQVETADADADSETEVKIPVEKNVSANVWQEPASASTEVSIETSYQSLSNGYGNWKDASINLMHKFSRRKVLYSTYLESERFNKRDRQLLLGFYQPLNQKWTLLVEANVSPTHKVLAKWSAMAQIERGFGNGWIGQAGFRRTELNSATVNIAKLGVEKYWGNNRAAYSASLINLKNTGTTGSQRIQYDRYYGSGPSSIGVGFTAGREVEDIGQSRVLQSDVYNVSINGKHWFHKNWALDYGYTFNKQGDIYNRQGARLGLRYKF